MTERQVGNSGNPERRGYQGHAIVGRFTYHHAGDGPRRLESAEKFGLPPGMAMIFYGENDNQSYPKYIHQDDLESLDRIIPEGSLQMLVVHDNEGRGLLVTNGSKEQSYGLLPGGGQNVMELTMGRRSFGFILGSSEKDAERILAERIANRARLN